MNVIFLTLDRFLNINDREISEDLMRKFRREGHNVYVVCPRERSFNLPTSLTEQGGVIILGVKTLNMQKSSIIEKGVGTLLIEGQFKRAIKKYFKGIKFDLILYTTPPITFTNVVKYLKKNNPHTKSYLLLKDIFPQNAVDMEMFSKKSPFWWYFREKEKALYKVSDFIGCMSPANVEFVLKHNAYVDPVSIEVAPNSIELAQQVSLSDAEKQAMRNKYQIPIDKPVFIYGGNLGKPQGIPFLIECLEANKNRKDCHFLIVGSGTEYGRIKEWFDSSNALSVSLYQRLPKSDYDKLVQCCDVGLIFLDHRFTIPNFPSRLLSYLEYKMPVLCATDPNTDMGRIAEKNGFGYWCESNSVEAFNSMLDKIINSDLHGMGEAGFKYLSNNFLVDNTYSAIIKHF
jgi:hypothetical protein